MAVKRTKRVVTKPVVEDWKPVVEEPKKIEKKFPKWPVAVAGLLLLLVLYWYKTGTWPVVAFVGGQPLFRAEVINELYKQGGDSIVDSLITEKLIRQELAKKNITVSDAEINDKVALVQKSLPQGTDLNQALADRGMTMQDLKSQIGLQLGIEKALADKVMVTDQEVNEYVASNSAYLQGTTSAEKAANAKETLRQSKLQDAIQVWVDQVRAAGKVWRLKKAN